MRKEIDRRLLVHHTCLMFFCDDTGHEDFRDQNYQVFGIGGCGIMAGAIDPVLKQPWRAMKAAHFGGSDVLLHASELRNPTQSQFDALNRFFREQEFCRFGVTITPTCKLPTGVTAYHAVSRSLRKRWEELTPRFSPTPTEVAFIFEASQRGDALVQRYFSDIVVTIAGAQVPIHLGIMPKGAGDEALEVADFIVHTAGTQARNWDTGDKRRFRRDFEAMFHANALWSSFSAIECSLILKPASASRPSGAWNDDDVDVLANGVVVGRIMKAAAAPVDQPWMWTLAFGHHEDRTPTHGYEATREAAMAAFAKSWRRE